MRDPGSSTRASIQLRFSYAFFKRVTCLYTILKEFYNQLVSPAVPKGLPKGATELGAHLRPACVFQVAALCNIVL